jgi:hypothetical protein
MHRLCVLCKSAKDSDMPKESRRQAQAASLGLTSAWVSGTEGKKPREDFSGHCPLKREVLITSSPSPPSKVVGQCNASAVMDWHLKGWFWGAVQAVSSRRPDPLGFPSPDLFGHWARHHLQGSPSNPEQPVPMGCDFLSITASWMAFFLLSLGKGLTVIHK